MSTYKFELWNILKHPIKTNKFLILDTETTGINTKTSFILQLSYILSDYKFTYNKEDIKDYIIKIDSDVNITNSYIHGITNKISKTKGLDINKVFDKFYKYLKLCTHIVAYNCRFDIEIITTELERHDREDIIEELNSKVYICPMRELKHIVCSKNKNGNLKFPRLEETYEFLCEKGLKNAHNARYDVINLTKIMRVFYKRFGDEFINNIPIIPLAKLTKKDLVELCKENNLKNYSKLVKADLIELLNENDIKA